MLNALLLRAFTAIHTRPWLRAAAGVVLIAVGVVVVVVGAGHGGLIVGGGVLVVGGVTATVSGRRDRGHADD